jgi:hypothetical protein
MARIAPQEQPGREGMKVRSGGQKSLNEHLGPLRRYLAGQVGRPWNNVFADICRHLDRSSAVQDHVRDHLADFVAICVIPERGKLLHGDGYGIGQPLRTPFYVCPRSGILRRNRNRRPHFRRLYKLPTRFIDGSTALVRKDGAWHLIEWCELPDRLHMPGRRWPVPADHLFVWDALLRTTIQRAQAEYFYGRPVRAVTARHANKREARRVINSYPYTNLVRR